MAWHEFKAGHGYGHKTYQTVEQNLTKTHGKHEG